MRKRRVLCNSNNKPEGRNGLWYLRFQKLKCIYGASSWANIGNKEENEEEEGEVKLCLRWSLRGFRELLLLLREIRGGEGRRGKKYFILRCSNK